MLSCLGFGEAEKNIFGAETDFQPMPEKLVLPKNTFVTNNNSNNNYNNSNSNSQLGWKNCSNLNLSIQLQLLGLKITGNQLHRRVWVFTFSEPTFKKVFIGHDDELPMSLESLNVHHCLGWGQYKIFQSNAPGFIIWHRIRLPASLGAHIPWICTVYVDLPSMHVHSKLVIYFGCKARIISWVVGIMNVLLSIERPIELWGCCWSWPKLFGWIGFWKINSSFPYFQSRQMAKVVQNFICEDQLL